MGVHAPTVFTVMHERKYVKAGFGSALMNWTAGISIPGM